MPVGLFEPFDLKEPSLQGRGGAAPTPAKDHLADPLEAPIQFDGGEGEAIHEVADEGLSGGGGTLPYFNTIQQSFGDHDVSGLKASTGSAASEACTEMGASAYAKGDGIAFKGTPDLHTAAHEAAHGIQQQHGVQLDGGVGEPGDKYEQHADEVADAVVAGNDAGPILDQMVGTSPRQGGVQTKAVQRKEDHHTAAGGRSGGEGTSMVKGAAIGFAQGFWNNIAVWNHVKAWRKDMAALRNKDEDSPRNRVYAQIGEGWRTADQIKETFQMVANVTTGLSVSLGLLSLIPFLSWLAPIATICGVIATLTHGITALFRAAKLGAMLGTYSSVTGAQDRAAMRSGMVREGAGLLINFIGWVFGAVGGVWSSGGAPSGQGTNLLQMGIDAEKNNVGATLAAAGMGEIGNRSQDMIGGAADNGADKIDQKFGINSDSTTETITRQPEGGFDASDLSDIDISGYDADDEWSDWDSTYGDWGDWENDTFVDDMGDPIPDVSAYMGEFSSELSAMDDLAEKEIRDDSLPDLDHDGAVASVQKILNPLEEIDDHVKKVDGVDPDKVKGDGKVEKKKLNEAEDKAVQHGVKVDKSVGDKDGSGGSDDVVQGEVVQMGLWSRFKNWVTGGTKRVKKLLGGIKAKLLGALGKSSGLTETLGGVSANLDVAASHYENAKLGTRSAADAGEALKDAVGKGRSSMP